MDRTHVHIDPCRSEGLHGQTVQRAVQHEDGSTKTDAAMRRGGQKERRERESAAEAELPNQGYAVASACV